MSRTLPKIRLISVGKPKGPWQEIVNDYVTRLSLLTQFEHFIIKESGDNQLSTRKQTSENIERLVPPGYKLWVCDERGKGLKSRDLASLLVDNATQPVCIVLGSSYGVTPELRQKADLVLRLSDMVLAHEVARVLVLEQLYRSHAILTNHPYHHD